MTDKAEKRSMVPGLIPLREARQIGSFQVSELPDDIDDELRDDAVAE